MSKKLTRLNLHDRLKKHAFEHAFLTTYNFGARFFEDYALENFKSLQDNGNVTVLLDEGEYRDLLNAAQESPESFPKQANLRYLLHPIQVPGVFHPKIFLFAGKKRGLLVIGSANFTQDGLGSNAEMVAVFDFEAEKSEEALPLFQSVLKLLEKLACRWPSEQLQSNLQTMIAEVPWLSGEAKAPDDTELPVLLENLEVPLWGQLVERLPGAVDHLHVLSRYYDARPGLAEFALQSAHAGRLTLYTQNGITTLTKDWLGSSAFKKGELDIRLCRYADEDHYQQLHGKALAFVCGKRVMLAMGSANFTSSALQRTAANGNLEVLICYPSVPATGTAIGEWFDPDRTSVILRTPDQLKTAEEPESESAAGSADLAVRIAEAMVDEQWLKLTLSHGQPEAGVCCRIVQSDRVPLHLKVKIMDERSLSCQLSETDRKRLRAAPSLAQLGQLDENGDWKASSHSILVTNLQDVRTGADLRRSRQIREARESPERFISVLNALCRDGDEERLKQFLTYCDIPMELPIRLLRRRSLERDARAATGEAFTVSSGRNIRNFELLHDAVMDFAKRHRRRLERHIESGLASGVPNYLHILLTLGQLLLSQIGRIIDALKSDSPVELQPQRWHDIRDHLDGYYRELRGLFKLTVIDYVQAFSDSRSMKKLTEEFREALPDLLALLDRAARLRDELAQLQQTRLVVLTLRGAITGPGFFKSVLAPDNWPAMAQELKIYGETLTQQFAA
jgi:hypothetical protein